MNIDSQFTAMLYELGWELSDHHLRDKQNFLLKIMGFGGKLPLY